MNVDIFDSFQDRDRVGVIVGTGPSLTEQQCERISQASIAKKCIVFAINLSFAHVVSQVLTATNKEFWYHYWTVILDYQQTFPLHCWTPYRPSADYFNINYIEERNALGLSIDKTYVHHHHGSGPIAVNLAYHYGCKKILLVGWDMRYPKGYNGHTKTIGQGKRHFFGEYPPVMQHWTKNIGPNGEIVGLIKEMETIKPADYGIEIINCTPGSALTCFPMADLKDVL